MTRCTNLARSSNKLDTLPLQVPLSAAASVLPVSQKTRMISAPRAKKPQAAQMPFQPLQSPVFESSQLVGGKVIARRSSWESGTSKRSSEKGPQESQISVVVSEADNSNESLGRRGQSSSRADRTTVSVYTDEFVKDLGR